MIPGPPPVMTAKPASTRARAEALAGRVLLVPRLVRAEPKTLTALPSSASMPKPSTNSDWMRSTRHGSVWTQSLGPRESSSRSSVVVSSTWPRRRRDRAALALAHVRAPVRPRGRRGAA